MNNKFNNMYSLRTTVVIARGWVIIVGAGKYLERLRRRPVVTEGPAARRVTRGRGRGCRGLQHVQGGQGLRLGLDDFLG